jgi:hypothetical protein
VDFLAKISIFMLLSSSNYIFIDKIVCMIDLSVSYHYTLFIILIYNFFINIYGPICEYFATKC